MATATAPKTRLDVLGEVLHRRYCPADQAQLIEDFAGDGRAGVSPMRRNILAAPGIQHKLYRFHSEHGQEVFPFFEPKSGLKKMCDYILFAEEGKHLYCLLIEMKESSGGASPQLAAAGAFVRFVLDTVVRVGMPFALQNVHTRYISIHERGSRKRGEREEEPEYDEQQWTKLTAQALRLAQLLK